MGPQLVGAIFLRDNPPQPLLPLQRRVQLARQHRGFGGTSPPNGGEEIHLSVASENDTSGV